MAELAALNVRINGDSGDLVAAVSQADASLNRLGTRAQTTTTQVQSTGRGMSRLASSFGRNGFAISNAANQFSDLAVQIGMGVPASRALSQQLPQLTAFMGPLANIIGVASGVLIGLAGNLLMTRDRANALTDALEAMDRVQGDLSAANDILLMSTYDLTVQYGEYAQAVRDAAASMALLAGAEAQQRMGEALADMSEALDGFTQRSGTAFRSGTMLSTAINNIADQFNITNGEARQLEQQFRALETATTFDQQVEALRQIEQFMEDTGANAANLPPELIAALQQLNQMVIVTAEVESALNNAAEAGANLRRSLPMSFGGSLEGIPVNSLLPPEQEGTQYQFGGNAATGGGGRQQTNPLIAQIEALQESLMTAEEMQVASYERQQQTLQSALEQRLITQQEYARMMEQVEQSHQYAMVQSANDGARQTLSNLATVFQGSKEIGAGIALANSWLAFTEVLKDPSFVGRPFARIAAAGAALASGLQAVRNIKAASPGGNSGGGGLATASASQAQNFNAGGGTSNQVAIQLTGGDLYSRDQVVQLINAINEAQEDGAVVRLV